MDDPLRVEIWSARVSNNESLNPCCNGWSSKSKLTEHKLLTEEGLNPCCNGWSSKS